MIKAIISYFTLEYEAYLFTDTVSGMAVNVYVDKYSERWMKDSRWSFFRVPYE